MYFTSFVKMCKGGAPLMASWCFSSFSVIPSRSLSNSIIYIKMQPCHYLLTYHWSGHILILVSGHIFEIYLFEIE